MAPVIAVLLCGCALRDPGRFDQERAIKAAIIRACYSACDRGGTAQEAASAFLAHEAPNEIAAEQLIAALRARTLASDGLIIEWVPRTYLERLGSAPRFAIGGSGTSRVQTSGGRLPNAVAEHLAETAQLYRIGRKGNVVFAIIDVRVGIPLSPAELALFLECCFHNGLYAIRLRRGEAPDYKMALRLGRPVSQGKGRCGLR